jgi:hypothetical protein
MCKNMKEKSEYPFTAEQYNKLNEEERGAVLAVAEYLAGGTVDISDEDLSSALNLMKESEGCVPEEEVDGDPLGPVRRKFAAVYQTAMELAETELQKQGLKNRQHFNFCLVIEPSYEDSTHVAVVDYDKPICYLHEWNKAWNFQFADLAALAEAVLSTKTALVNKFKEFNAKEVIVVLEEGRVREVVGLPPNTQVTVVDYDVEDEDEQHLAPSPIDGQKCKLTKF